MKINFKLFFFINLLVFSLFGCKKKSYTPKPYAETEKNSPVDLISPKPQLNLKIKTVEILLPENKKIFVKAQVAQTEVQQAKGLMFRKYLPENEGMLFVYDKPSELGFYMANCYISLDMIFMDSNKRVIGFLKNAKPMDSTVRSIGKPSQYVLEVNGGFADKYHITVGTQMKWED